MTSLLNSIKQVLNEEKQNLEEKDENRKNINAKFSSSEHEAIRKALDAAVNHWDGKGTPDYMTSLKRMAKRDKNWTFNTDEVQFMYDAIADLPQHAKTAAMLKRKLSMVEVNEDAIGDLIAKYAKTGRTAFRYPRKKMISINGRLMSEKDAVAIMKRIIKEELELDEAIKSKNQYGGYRNEVGSDAEYAKTHAMLKKLLGKDDTTIRDYMDSTSGRHLAGLEGDTAYIKKDFKKFMKKYDPSFFKEGVEVDARRKSFKEALKRIEGYKAKKSMKTEGSKEEYEKFFKGAMKKFGITDLGDLEGKKEKEFYDYVDANWKAKDESVIEKVRKIVNEKRKQRTKAMNEVDDPSCQKDKDLVDFHKRNTQVKSDI